MSSSVEDQVLRGPWEEIVGIPDEEMRKRPSMHKKDAPPPPQPHRSGSLERRDPDQGQALLEYLDSRLQGGTHTQAANAAAAGRWFFWERARKG